MGFVDSPSVLKEQHKKIHWTCHFTEYPQKPIISFEGKTQGDILAIPFYGVSTTLIISFEGTIQGDTLEMPFYRVSMKPVIRYEKKNTRRYKYIHYHIIHLTPNNR